MFDLRVRYRRTENIVLQYILLDSTEIHYLLFSAIEVILNVTLFSYILFYHKFDKALVLSSFSS